MPGNKETDPNEESSTGVSRSQIQPFMKQYEAVKSTTHITFFRQSVWSKLNGKNLKRVSYKVIERPLEALRQGILIMDYWCDRLNERKVGFW